MNSIDDDYLRKPRFRESFMPLQIEESCRPATKQKSVWAWVRTLVKNNNGQTPQSLKYSKVRDKCYYVKTAPMGNPIWPKIWAYLDQHHPAYQPEHPALFVWYIIIQCILYLHYIQIPLSLFFWNIVFEDEFSTTWSLLFNYVSIFLLAMDMLIRFGVAFYRHGLIVTNRQAIAKRYMSWRFCMDIIALGVLTIYIFVDQQRLVYFKILFYLKLYQTYEYDISIQNVIELNLVLISLYKILRIIGIFVLYSHIMACGYFYLDYYLYQNDSYYLQNGFLWLTNSAAMPVNMIETYNWYIWYLYALYWALQTATTVGYGDITPKNPQEVLYVIINMIFMCVMFGYFINSVWEIIADWSDKSQRYKQNFSSLNRYLKNKSISQNLQQKLRAYLNYLWKEDTIEDIEETIVGKLTPGLRDELTLNIKYPFFLKLRFFNSLENYESRSNFAEFKRRVANEIKQQRYSQGEVIYRESSNDCRLFYILEGKTELRVRNYSTEVLVSQNFGQQEFLTEQPRCFTAVATKYSYFYFLEKSTFRSLIGQYPSMEETYFQQRDKVLVELDVAPTGIYCYCCYESHYVTSCPQLVFIPEKTQGLQTQSQQRTPFDRSNRLKARRNQEDHIFMHGVGNFEQSARNYNHYNPKHNLLQIKLG